MIANLIKRFTDICANLCLQILRRPSFSISVRLLKTLFHTKDKKSAIFSDKKAALVNITNYLYAQNKTNT